MDVRSGRLAEHALRGRGLELRELSDRADAVTVQLLRRHRADSPQPLDGKRQQELLLPVGLDDEESVGLAHRTRHLGEELRAGDADRDREARLGAHALPQPDGDGLGSAGDASQPADLEERLVDGEPFHERGGVAEDAEDVFAGRGIGLHPRRDDDGVGAQLPRLPATHRGADAACLRLVARGQHDPAADDHRTPAELRRITLLDRGVERIEIGVQNRRFPAHPVLPSTSGSSHGPGTSAWQALRKRAAPQTAPAARGRG